MTRQISNLKSQISDGGLSEEIPNPKSATRNPEFAQLNYDELLEPIAFDFSLSRRGFVQVLGAGILISVVVGPALGQRRGRGGRGGRDRAPVAISARIHIGNNGKITVLSGKVDCGQGARGEIAQAAAEELRVPVDQVAVVLADTSLVPDDGITAGSGTTPRTIPAVRHAAAAVRKMLIEHAARTWGKTVAAVEFRDGKASEAGGDRRLSYADFAQDEQAIEQMSQVAPSDIEVTPVGQWKVLGQPQGQPSARDKVTGNHQFPSDITRPGMLYGKILRPALYRAKLASVDVGPAKAMKDVVVVHDGDFLGVAAPTTHQARLAIEAIGKTAKWEDEPPMPSSDELYDYLREQTDGGVPTNPFADVVANAAKTLKATYTIAYVQHAPLEPRTATAEWTDGKLAVWTGTSNPFSVKGELQRAFRLGDDAVRVVVPDFGSGYGGKHTGEAAVEAARLAREAGKPVKLTWTREEEFTGAYFRPAGVLDMEASLDGANRISSWWQLNISSGGQSIEAPYNFEKKESRSVRSKPPLREGSYRALASTANTFARESFMDELAAAAEIDPLEFRLAYLDHPRLRPVLEMAAEKFKWTERVKDKKPHRGVGLACSLDKGSFVAACAEVEVDPQKKEIRVLEVCEAFECGPVLNPDNVKSQIEGAVVMALGPALTEEIRFKDGKIENASFMRYRTPKLHDAPTVDVHLLPGTGYDSVGAGETPLIPVAPAIANAVFHATGKRLRSMPMRLKNA